MTTKDIGFTDAAAEPPELDVEESRTPEDKAQSWYATVWSSGKARVGIIILAVYVLVGIFAPLIAPYSPTDGSFTPLMEPSLAHPMGTNQGGRDIFSQLIMGTRVSLLVGLLGGSAASLIALVIGLIAGYLEGTIVDDLLSFCINVLLVTPVFQLVLVMVGYAETRGLWLIVAIIAITSWAGPARHKRAQIVTLRNRDFITAAKFSGVGTMGVIFKEIMPNMVSLVAIGFLHAATAAIGAEAGLAVLGLGSPDSVSWGTVLYQAQQSGAITQGLWLWVFLPGLVLAGLMTALTFVNFGVDLLSNPHLREG